MIETKPRLPSFYQLRQAAYEAGHIHPDVLASCIIHSVKAGMTVEDAIDQWRRAEPEKFRSRNVLRKR